MTPQEFWDELRQSKQNWIIDNSDIRADNDDGYFCPITEVCYRVTGQWWNICEWQEAARVLNLDSQFAGRIVDAADGYDGALRYNLLQILSPRLD